ncbi:hypothetical protein [Nocardia nepalensis]|uniref:hypothetical protein n=1 Tax=Nocardia nepalensis TaxID=3375448 RepID=UPI003B685E62
MADPFSHMTFVHAEGTLAEYLCQVHLMELTPERARQLLKIHRYHHPDDCTVHAEAAYLLVAENES